MFFRFWLFRLDMGEYLLNNMWSKMGKQRLLCGPICPIYGFGSIIALFVYDLTASGYLLELTWRMIFHIRLCRQYCFRISHIVASGKIVPCQMVDYSKYPLNINGRASIPTSMLLAVRQFLLMRVLIPQTDKIVGWLSNRWWIFWPFCLLL